MIADGSVDISNSGVSQTQGGFPPIYTCPNVILQSFPIVAGYPQPECI